MTKDIDQDAEWLARRAEEDREEDERLTAQRAVHARHVGRDVTGTALDSPSDAPRVARVATISLGGVRQPRPSAGVPRPMTAAPSPVPVTAPFPWFGGKSRAAAEVWRHFGDVPNYVEPFAGSLAVLLGRPPVPGRRTETVNDLDGLLSNFWRSVANDPDAVAAHADWPVSEVDLHARHAWLVTHRAALTERLVADPDWFDARAAGWWVWGICSWIGSGWCSGDGPWQVVDGVLTDTRKLPHLGDAGRGINRKLPHLGDAGQGINRQLPHLGDAGQGINQIMRRIADRLRDVRVCSGDWTRVVTDSVTIRHGTTGILLDPPYGDDAHGDYYAADSRTVAADVRAWCLENGHRPDLRIAYCGYATDGPDPLTAAGWTVHRWKAHGGYGGGRGGQADTNSRRETIWFSPACLTEETLLDLLGSP